jgi:hypothetical protein
MSTTINTLAQCLGVTPEAAAGIAVLLKSEGQAAVEARLAMVKRAAPDAVPDGLKEALADLFENDNDGEE